MNPEGILESHLPEYVILHAMWMESKGRRPCIGWNGITYPDIALTGALEEVNSGNPYLISLVQSRPHEVIGVARILKNHPRLYQATIYLEISVDVMFCLIDSKEVPEVDRANWVLYHRDGTRPCDGKLEKVEIPWTSIKEGEQDHGPMIKIFVQIPQIEVNLGATEAK